ncbi:MAG: hypothetical protein J6U28_08440 [Bacteroidales bacterium]|nr:hypothetical protein [Bacteroidales bacterium]
MSKSVEKKGTFEPIYTRDEAAKIVEMFENILVENGISVPSPEDDDNLGLYGSVYSDLLDGVEDTLVKIILRRGPHGPKNKLTEVNVGQFSGKI